LLQEGNAKGAKEMKNHEAFYLREAGSQPSISDVEHALGDSYHAYETFQNSLPQFDIQQEWQWYTPYKAWFAKGQHKWTTPRGTKKEKTLYWLYIFNGHFSVAVWFKEKNRHEVLNANVSERAQQLILNAETMGKLPTFPVLFDITSTELLADIYVLIECKKRLEK